jgi:hypothetical protein
VALTYTQLTELLLQSDVPFSIKETLPDGRIQTYRGLDVRTFYANDKNHLHEHKVFSSEGKLLYHRDRNGRVYMGEPGQWRKYERKKAAGRTALSNKDIFLNGVEVVKRRWLG